MGDTLYLNYVCSAFEAAESKPHSSNRDLQLHALCMRRSMHDGGAERLGGP